MILYVLVLHRAPDFAPRSQLQSPTTITHLISHSSLLPSFPCLISPFPYLCWTSQIIYLYWNLGLGGLLQGVPTPRQTLSVVPGSLETLRVKWLGYQGSQRSLHPLSVGKTSLHATQALPPIIRVNNQPGSVHKAQSSLHVSSARLSPCVVSSAPPEADHHGVPPGTTLHPPRKPSVKKPVSSG